MSNALFFLLILACPLMMIFMMRGHGHGGHNHGAADERAGGGHQHEREHCSHDDISLEELKQRRDELDRQIAARESADSEVGEHEKRTPQPVA